MKLKTHKRRIISVVAIVLVLVVGVGAVKNRQAIKHVLLKYKDVEPKVSGSSYYKEYPMLRDYDDRFSKNLVVFPFRMKDVGRYSAYSPDFLKQSGFGIQFFAFGFVAFLIAGGLFIFNRSYRNGIGGFVFSYSTLLLASYFVYYFSDASYRMFMFFPVCGLILWAGLVERFSFRGYYLKYIDVLIAGMLVFNMGACLLEGHRDIYRVKTFFTATNSVDRTAIKFSTHCKKSAWQFIDRYLEPHEPIAYLAHYDSVVFPYFDNRMQRRIYHLKGLPGFRLLCVTKDKRLLRFTPQLIESMRRLKIHYFHLNPEGHRAIKEKNVTILLDKHPHIYPITANLYYLNY